MAQNNEREAVVAWLRQQITQSLVAYTESGVDNADQAMGNLTAMQQVADLIERGAHLPSKQEKNDGR